MFYVFILDSVYSLTGQQYFQLRPLVLGHFKNQCIKQQSGIAYFPNGQRIQQLPFSRQQQRQCLHDELLPDGRDAQ